ncbi:hypothetical protein [Massilia sp. CF038]|uniref:hypothetical protein n=1 Tax=Massilia sp. CF038 TaxID=1881045 RepID=UPI000923DE67|nr:hypothetical protein [Massilia sp. CF038]SHG63451.1 hypothetical protein SAMN05428948_1374 [Massilia sp. CF038]
MNFDEVEYSFLVASEVHLRDGLGFEVYRHGAEKEIVLEIFRDDSKLQYVVSQFVPNLPLSLIEYVAKVARNELGGFAAEVGQQQSFEPPK